MLSHIDIKKIDHVPDAQPVRHVAQRAADQAAAHDAQFTPRAKKNATTPSAIMNSATSSPCPANIPKATPVFVL
jgi:hypothetical protein